MPVIQILTDRLMLRCLTDADVQAIGDQIADWNVVSMLARPPHPYTI